MNCTKQISNFRRSHYTHTVVIPQVLSLRQNRLAPGALAPSSTVGFVARRGPRALGVLALGAKGSGSLHRDICLQFTSLLVNVLGPAVFTSVITTAQVVFTCVVLAAGGREAAAGLAAVMLPRKMMGFSPGSRHQAQGWSVRGTPLLLVGPGPGG